ncbi:hypothetical protein DPSP01_008916 [Paraphaeosphaeria sporulosa]|uniref:Uncharacterized protein n=1 Tax=Paraphaeosphaeria sporulosa TaxID=1460663 RepID=A0A177CJK8_9PLEO|nr:uncharacterized protein CC84DRAFT_1163798 [Paraphaeosphaeria sporulosa]OAG07683.1 hypothetical protein CC84DRAFT_1163798 [Paraphaeosphaeria sporulosa]
MKFFSRQQKLSYARNGPNSPTSSQIAIPPRSSHTPPPSEIARLPRPEPIPQAPREPQIIQDRYIDGDKLLAMCQKRYGIENCRLKYKNERYYLQAPELIGEDILQQCETYSKS